LRRAKNRHTALRLPAIPRLRIAATILSSVRSGWLADSACCRGGVLPPLGWWGKPLHRAKIKLQKVINVGSE
jgi:hypothetical protein